MASPLFNLIYGQQQPVQQPQQNFNNNTQMNQLKQMYQSGGNPMGLIPSEIQQMFANNGNNYQQIFYMLAKQRGVDPQSVLDFLQKK